MGKNLTPVNLLKYKIIKAPKNKTQLQNKQPKS
jgi:hypothetical protein